MEQTRVKTWKFTVLFITVFLLLSYVLLISSLSKNFSIEQIGETPIEVSKSQLVTTHGYAKILPALLLKPQSYLYQGKTYIPHRELSDKVTIYTLSSLIISAIVDVAIPIFALFIMALTSIALNAAYQTKRVNKALQPICKKVDNIIASYQYGEEQRTNTANISELHHSLDALHLIAKDYRSNAEESIYCDKLTKLVDRHNFLTHIDKQIKLSAAKSQRSALLFIDLDGFKQVNDSYGHSFGDEVLIQVAERLRSIVRRQNLSFTQDDTELEYNLARLGGDEFTLFIQTLDTLEQAVDVARHVLQELERDFILGNKTIKISASVGIAVYPDSASTPHALIQMADVAMYRAKTDGRGIYRIYSPEMGANMRRYHYLLDEMRLAIDSGNFFLTFQPVINVDGCHINYFEALVRWQHPVEGTITPDEFIPIAENSNLILELGDWILDEACRQMAAWYNAGMKSARISVNISAVQLKYKTLSEWVLASLQKTALPPTSLMLEITESCFIDAPDEAIRELEKLRQAGVIVAIDDFGTGFSSLAVLGNLPVDVLKIDKLFVSEAMKNKKYNKILHSIVDMAKQLELKVVAEGIEHVEQFELLKSLGVKYIQGYLISRPQRSSVVGEKIFDQGYSGLAQTGTSTWLPQTSRLTSGRVLQSKAAS